VPKRGRSKGTKKSKKIVIFVKAVTKTGASVWPGNAELKKKINQIFFNQPLL
jgi:hypothetical protein